MALRCYEFVFALQIFMIGLICISKFRQNAGPEFPLRPARGTEESFAADCACELWSRFHSVVP